MIDSPSCAVLVFVLVAFCLGLRFGITRFPSYMMPGVAFGCYIAVFVASTIGGAIVGAFTTGDFLLWTGTAMFLCLTQFALGHVVGDLIRCLRAPRSR